MKSSPLCPVCEGSRLKTMKTEAGLVWACPHCEGRSLSIYPLRKRVQRKFINELWQAARSQSARPAMRPCPHCRRPMRAVFIRGVSEEFELDVCLPCQCLWFDAGEPAQLPFAPPEPKKMEPELSPDARRALALLRVKSIADKARLEADTDGVWRTARLGGVIADAFGLIFRLLFRK